MYAFCFMILVGKTEKEKLFHMDNPCNFFGEFYYHNRTKKVFFFFIFFFSCWQKYLIFMFHISQNSLHLENLMKKVHSESVH